MALGSLVGIVRFRAIEHQMQRDVKFVVVDLPLILLRPRTGREMNRARVFAEILSAGGHELVAGFGGMLCEGLENYQCKYGLVVN